MADLNIRPLADRVIIEPAAAETTDCIWNHYS
jgi:co-chaperonin GroES (HSP10)